MSIAILCLFLRILWSVYLSLSWFWPVRRWYKSYLGIFVFLCGPLVLCFLESFWMCFGYFGYFGFHGGNFTLHCFGSLEPIHVSFNTLVSLCVYLQTFVFNFSHFASFCGRSLSLKWAFGSIFVVFATLVFFFFSRPTCISFLLGHGSLQLFPDHFVSPFSNSWPKNKNSVFVINQKIKFARVRAENVKRWIRKLGRWSNAY